MNKSEYTKKFKDPLWQEKRLRIMERDMFSCRSCFRKDNTLNVHHKYYILDKDPWDYEDGALVTLCEECHELEHSEKKQYEQLLIQTLYNSGFLADDLREIACGFNSFKMDDHPKVVASAISIFLSKVKNQKKIVNDFVAYKFKKATI